MEQRFVPLLLVVLLAFIVPLLLNRFRRVPVVVGEIMAGIIVGPSLLGWVHSGEPILEILAEIGFAFLMFLSGLEIDFSLLFASSPERKKKKEAKPLWLALGNFGITLALAAAIGWGFASSNLVRDPWMMMLILSTTSLGIVLPVLKERHISGSRLGQTILLAALLADFLTMLMITIYVAVRSTGLSFEILLILVLFLVLVLLYQIGVRNLRRASIRRIFEDLADATSQIKVRGAFAIMITFVVIAQLVGAELILGAFLGGVLASLLSGPNDEKLRHKLDAMGYGFFVPIFFINVGLGFDVSAFLHNTSAWILIPLLLLAAFIIKLIASLVFRISHSWRETMASGFLLSSRLSLIIAASAIGLRMGVISDATNAAIIMTAALTSTFSPLVFNLLLPEKEGKHHRFMIIYGSSTLAFQVARELHAHGDEVCFIEPDPGMAEQVREANYPVTDQLNDISMCLGDYSETDVNAFLALSANDEENLRVCRDARFREFNHIIANISDVKYVPDFRNINVQTFNANLHRGSLLALMARNPALFELMTSSEDQRDLREALLKNRTLSGKSLSAIHFSGEILVLAIQRGDDVIVPHGNSRLQIGDRLTLMGDLGDLQKAEEWLAEQ